MGWMSGHGEDSCVLLISLRGDMMSGQMVVIRPGPWNRLGLGGTSKLELESEELSREVLPWGTKQQSHEISQKHCPKFPLSIYEFKTVKEKIIKLATLKCKCVRLPKVTNKPC